jgi:glycosyltransferase involved in cell wall biosynthesis
MREGTAPGLRVLMTADTVGGVLTYALTLASELERYGAEVHLATMGAPLRDAQRAAAAAATNVVLHESVYALEWMPAPWEDVMRAADWLLEVERAVAPDIVHLNGYCHGSAAFRAPVVVVGHSCVLSWWRAVLGEPAPLSLDRYRIEVTRGLEGAAAVIAPTAAMMAALARHYRFLPALRAVVPNGVPAPAPRAKAATPKERSVLAAGRVWDPAKNIEALTVVAPAFPGPVRVAGSAELPDGSFRSFPNVELLGWLDPPVLEQAMERAAIFAHPARYEPFGLAPVEAALRGCALVLGDIESLREVWADAAVFVDPKDHHALAVALDAYAHDEDLRREYAMRAEARARTFTPDRMARGVLEVYARVLATRRVGTASAVAERRRSASCG